MNNRVEQLLKNILQLQCNTNKILMNLGNCGDTNLSITPFTATYTPPILQNGQSDLQTVNVPGVLLSKINIISIATDVSIYQGVIFSQWIEADGKMKIYIENQSGEYLAIPQLTYIINQIN